jgi:hypothetical protein
MGTAFGESDSSQHCWMFCPIRAPSRSIQNRVPYLISPCRANSRAAKLRALVAPSNADANESFARHVSGEWPEMALILLAGSKS